MTTSIEKQSQICLLAQSGRSLIEIKKQIGLSENTIRRVLKRYSVPLSFRRRSQFALLKEFNSGKIKSGHNSKIRYSLLHAYRNTCWDCKRTFVSELDLHTHHDFSELPVRVFILCRNCHAKRHNRSRI